MSNLKNIICVLICIFLFNGCSSKVDNALNVGTGLDIHLRKQGYDNCLTLGYKRIYCENKWHR